ncbi:biopolymer transporter TolR [Flavobacterium franklandianum]|uniref:TolB family protein n=1 Tax=Flavobacterium franklandianum TaxID=2594430 RepID=UPI00117B640E|nr:TolB family protein [Flavobacterium franklandianum]TRX24831.1 biopolymer transporter TolR [Flavobacterium franklandianum]
MKKMLTQKSVYQLLSMLIILCITNKTFSQNSNLGIFDKSEDIGTCLIKGSSVYNPEIQEYTMSGSGDNMWFGKDAFQYLYKEMKGDFILQFEFKFTSPVKIAHRKVGWMVRNDTSLNSPHINGTVHNDGLTSIQYRLTKGANTLELKMKNLENNTVIQLERRGNRYVFSAAIKGEEFKTIEWVDSDNVINDNALVGMFICSHDNSDLQTAVIKNVRITIPAKADYRPYKDYIGSNLEIMDIATGDRKIIFTAPNSIQAPNWTNDGKTLIYNSEGKLYNFDLKTRQPSELDSKFAIKNNNDHALSFDGKMLGISNSSENKDDQSQVFIMPSKGGTPKLITEKAPSYFHGFSIDGKNMLFTGGRDGQDNFEIYSINIKTKVETRLTNSLGLDDGSEYSPDGKYIYFNSVRSGKMQIWRINPDGSNPERITNDESNNWFPHVSPNGKMIVYITFGDDVLPGDHPFYKHVSLRLMDLETSEVKILAHLYGGQGTINVPSWSPDSKKITFITNTALTDYFTKCY